MSGNDRRWIYGPDVLLISNTVSEENDSITSRRHTRSHYYAQRL